MGAHSRSSSDVTSDNYQNLDVKTLLPHKRVKSVYLPLPKVPSEASVLYTNSGRLKQEPAYLDRRWGAVVQEFGGHLGGYEAPRGLQSQPDPEYYDIADENMTRMKSVEQSGTTVTKMKSVDHSDAYQNRYVTPPIPYRPPPLSEEDNYDEAETVIYYGIKRPLSKTKSRSEPDMKDDALDELYHYNAGTDRGDHDTYLDLPNFPDNSYANIEYSHSDDIILPYDFENRTSMYSLYDEPDELAGNEAMSKDANDTKILRVGPPLCYDQHNYTLPDKLNPSLQIGAAVDRTKSEEDTDHKTMSMGPKSAADMEQITENTGANSQQSCPAGELIDHDAESTNTGEGDKEEVIWKIVL